METLMSYLLEEHPPATKKKAKHARTKKMHKSHLHHPPRKRLHWSSWSRASDSAISALLLLLLALLSMLLVMLLTPLLLPKDSAPTRSGRRPCPTRTRERGIPILRWVVRAKGGPAKRRNKRENRMKDIMNLEVPQPVSTGSVPEPAPLEVPMTCTNK